MSCRQNGIGSSGSRTQTVDNNHGLSNGLTNGHQSDNVKIVAEPEMCAFCFDVLDGELGGTGVKRRPTFSNDAYPFFVTWKIGRDQRLRGCIGTFSPMNLHTGLREYACTSAFNDSRFPPIAKDELSSLSVSVSLLVHFEDGCDFMDWTIGVHGIRIDFTGDRGQKRSATYLPQIASEQGWDHVETIDSLLRKGGFRGTITDAVRRDIKLVRYQSQVVDMTHREWLDFGGKVKTVQSNGW